MCSNAPSCARFLKFEFKFKEKDAVFKEKEILV